MGNSKLRVVSVIIMKSASAVQWMHGVAFSYTYPWALGAILSESMTLAESAVFACLRSVQGQFWASAAHCNQWFVSGGLLLLNIPGSCLILFLELPPAC
jgi:hypothetical protein